MSTPSGSDKYGAVAKGFHWITALLVLGLIAAGLLMVNLEPTPQTFKIYFLHKSFGIVVLTLVLARLIWRILNPPPAPLSSHKAWEKVLARFVHVFFYAALFAMPLSGWVMSSAKGFSVSVFNLFTLPDFVPVSSDLAKAANLFHEVVAYILIVAIGLHAAGALKHHFIDKDGTLRRMLPFGRVVGVLLFLLMVSVPPARAANDMPSWVIDPAASTLTFEGKQMGAAFTGTFKTFGGTILFDPARLGESRVEIVVDIKSADTKSPDRDGHILKMPWFDAESFPESKFIAAKFEKTAENQYVAHGDLTIRGVSLPVVLPFSLSFSKNESGAETATAQGGLSVKRLDFGVGQGEWKDTQMIDNEVKIMFFVAAVRAGTSP